MTLLKSKSLNHSASSAASSSYQECADCGSRNIQWASVNHGVIICDECCLAHRNLGRCISVIKSLRKSYWPQSLIDTLYDLVRSNSNQILESNLNHVIETNKGLSKTIKKPTPKDSSTTKLNFIRMKYENLAFISRGKYSSIEELNQQLVAAVKTNNVELTLRILTQGADANYRNHEDGNQCLHIAVLNNQIGQIELLCLYGADVCCLDRNGQTPVELAKQNNQHQIAERLYELQFELTDELSFYLCNKRADHKAEKHFLIPINSVESTANLEEMSKNTKQKLQLLPDHLFEELSKDIYDEMDRRQIETIWKFTVGPKLVNEPIPFLIIKSCFTQTRNQLRQKLARFSSSEFSTLLTEILIESQRRYNQLNNNQLSSKNINSDEKLKITNIYIDEDDQLYDKVPSDEDYASVAESEASTTNMTDSKIKNKQNQNFQRESPLKLNPNRHNSKTPTSPSSCKSSSSNNNDKSHNNALVANAESALNSIINSLNKMDCSQQQYIQRRSDSVEGTSATNITLNELKNENELMQSMIERLMEENAQLRAEKMILSSSLDNTNNSKINNLMIRSQFQQQDIQNLLNHGQCEDLNLYATVTNKKMNAREHLNERENFYLTNNSSENKLNNIELSSNGMIVHCDKKLIDMHLFDNYDGENFSFLDQNNSSLNNNFEHDYESSLLNSNMLFERQLKIIEDQNDLNNPFYDELSLNAKSSPFKSTSHDQDFYNQQKNDALCEHARSNSNALASKSLNGSFTSDQPHANSTKEIKELPTKNSVIRKMKKITKAVQDLFKATKESEFSLLKDLCDKVNQSVHEMIVLFPINMEANSIQENLVLLDSTCKSLVELVNKYHSKAILINNACSNIDSSNEQVSSITTITTTITEHQTQANDAIREQQSNPNKTSLSNSSSSSSAISSGSMNDFHQTALSNQKNQIASKNQYQESIALKNMMISNLVNYSYEIAHTVKKIVCIVGADS